jgi:hypothetical protein
MPGSFNGSGAYTSKKINSSVLPEEQWDTQNILNLLYE